MLNLIASLLLAELTAASPLDSADRLQSRQSQPSKYLFVFGDSYTDTKFNWNKTLPAVGNPFGNPAYPGQTSAGNGKENWIDYLVTGSMPAGTIAYNHAVGGAPSNYTRINGFHNPYLVGSGIPQDLIEEIDKLKVNVPSKVPGANSQNSLVITWFGINDVSQIIGKKNSDGSLYSDSQVKQLINDDMSDYWQQMYRLYDTLGQRNFLHIQVPPISRSPQRLVDYPDTVGRVYNYVNYWNSQFEQVHKLFVASRSGLNSALYNPTNLFNTILNNPTQYGADNNTCRGQPPARCLWTDDIHPREMVHANLAPDIFKTIRSMGFA